MNVVERKVSDGHGALSPSYVCIHETANPGATALNHVSLWSRDDTYAVHYVADWTGNVYHCVPDDRLCWQVGNGNAHVIGIELCHARSSADFARVWDAGVEWAAWMLKKRGWGVDRLISHDDARRKWGGTDHTDPIGYFREFGRTWDQFVKAVEQKMEGKPKQQPGNAKNGAGVRYHAHCQTVGDLAAVRDGQVAGLTGAAKRLEQIVIEDLPEGWEVDAFFHQQKSGWRTVAGITKANCKSRPIGDKGKALRIEAIGFRVVKKPAGDNRTLRFQVHQQTHGWKAETAAPYFSGSDGESKRLEAVRLWIA